MIPAIKLYDDDFLNKMLSSSEKTVEPYFHLVAPFPLEGSKTCTEGCTEVNPYGKFLLDYTSYTNYRWYSVESASSYTNKTVSSSSCFSRTTIEAGEYCITPTKTPGAQIGSGTISITLNADSSCCSTYNISTGVSTSFYVYENTNITYIEPKIKCSGIFEAKNIGFSLYRIGDAPEVEYTGTYWNQLAPELNTTNWNFVNCSVDSEGVLTSTDSLSYIQLKDVSDFTFGYSATVSTKNCYWAIFEAKLKDGESYSVQNTQFKISNVAFDQATSHQIKITSDWQVYTLPFQSDFNEPEDFFIPTIVGLRTADYALYRNIKFVNVWNCYGKGCIPSIAHLELKKHIFDEGYSAYSADTWKVNGKQYLWGAGMYNSSITNEQKYYTDTEIKTINPKYGYGLKTNNQWITSTSNGSYFMNLASDNTEINYASEGSYPWLDSYYQSGAPKGIFAIKTSSIVNPSVCTPITIEQTYGTVASYDSSTNQLTTNNEPKHYVAYFLYNETQNDFYNTRMSSSYHTITYSKNGTTPAVGDVLKTIATSNSLTFNGTSITFGYVDNMLNLCSVGDVLLVSPNPNNIYTCTITAVDTSTRTLTVDTDLGSQIGCFIGNISYSTT